MPQNGPFHIKLSLARAKSVAAFKTIILSYCTPNPLLPCSSELSKWFFPASLAPPWCLAGCPIDPFLPSWRLPGATQAVQMVRSCLPGASLVPRWLSDGSFPASLVLRRRFQRQSRATRALLKAILWALKGNPVLREGL